MGLTCISQRTGSSGPGLLPGVMRRRKRPRKASRWRSASWDLSLQGIGTGEAGVHIGGGQRGAQGVADGLVQPPGEQVGTGGEGEVPVVVEGVQAHGQRHPRDTPLRVAQAGVRECELDLHVGIVGVQRLGSGQVPLRPLEVAPIEQDAAQDEVGDVVPVVHARALLRVGVGMPLVLVPALPGHAAPLVEMGEGQARVGAGEARVQGQSPLEQGARLHQALRRPLAELGQTAQPAVVGRQVLEGLLGGGPQLLPVDAHRQRQRPPPWRSRPGRRRSRSPRRRSARTIDSVRRPRPGAAAPMRRRPAPLARLPARI